MVEKLEVKGTYLHASNEVHPFIQYLHNSESQLLCVPCLKVFFYFSAKCSINVVVKWLSKGELRRVFVPLNFLSERRRGFIECPSDTNSVI